VTPRLDKRLPRQRARAGLVQSPPCGWFAAFTLVELLVVIAIIGLLAGLLLPTLGRAKARAQSITCLNNSRQLTFAWILYSSDYSDHLVYNLGGNLNVDSRSAVAPAGQPNWVNNIMDWTLSPDNTNTAFVSDSLLGPYASFSLPIYKCPADRALSDVQKSAGWSARVRSVSMNAMVGDPGTLLNSGANVNNPGYKQFLRETDIPSPANIFIFLDEHPDSINDGYFIDKPPYNPGVYASVNQNWAWTDLPASGHNGGAGFSFADGHSLIHQWVSPSTIRPAAPEGASLPMPLDPNDTSDINWVLKRMSIVAGN
jgi:prepilin-type N-terminal cleavage/methylation domain-containing protein